MNPLSYTAAGRNLVASASRSSPVRSATSNVRFTFTQVARHLVKIDAADTLMQPLSKLYNSYVHMHCNRLWVDQTGEARALGLLLRAREAIAHGSSELLSDRQAASIDGNAGGATVGNFASQEKA
jgi:Lantibiotic biosynthesis dehydratase C-term